MGRPNQIAAVLVVALARLAMAPEAAGGQAVPIDTAAIGALNRMAAYLNTLDAFQVRAATTTDDVLTDGQKIQSASRADLVVDRPNRLRLDLSSDREQRLFLYDGRDFTLWAPRLRYYATVPAPSTIRALADSVEARYDLELPLVDLFRWGTPESRFQDITAARDIGPSPVGGITCEQYAVRQAGLDWQIWIQEGAYPLPCKVVLTTLTDEARPEHTVVYSWNLAPSFNDAAFTFVAPSDARRITLAEVRAARGVPSGRRAK
jgi:hypothetical protein